MHLHIMTKAQAIEIGINHYVSSRLCKHGHFSLRFVCGGGCIICRKIKYEQNGDETRRIERERLRAKPEYVKAKNQRYYLENKEQIKKDTLAYQNKNKDKRAAWSKKSYNKNKEKITLTHKKYYENNKDYLRPIRKNWREKNRELCSVYSNRRRSRNSNAEGSFKASDILKLILLQKSMCAICRAKIVVNGKRIFHVDHIIALAIGGSNWPDNLQLLCARCNLSKGAKHPIDWAKQNGRLF